MPAHTIRISVSDDMCLQLLVSEEYIWNDLVALMNCSPARLDIIDFNSRHKDGKFPVDGPKLWLYPNNDRGQMLSQNFHWQHRAASEAGGKPSAYAYLKENSEKLKELDAEKRIKELNDKSALRTMTHFRATVSKHLAEEMEAKRVLDPCGGWGDRLTGFLASSTVKEITVIDPREGAVKGYKEQAEFINTKKTLKAIQGKAEEELPKLPDGHFDLILTSPPYFNLETYLDKDEAKDRAKAGQWDTVDKYKENFLKPMLTQSARLLREGGLLAINVDDNHNEKVYICETTVDTLKEAGLEFIGIAGLEKAVWKKDKKTKVAEPIFIFGKGEVTDAKGRLPMLLWGVERPETPVAGEKRKRDA